MGQTKSITFVGMAAARAQTTLVSRPIGRPWRLERITVRFPAGCQDLVGLAFWASPDTDAPTSGNPTGVNLLQDYSQATYVRGDGETVTLPHQIDVPDTGMSLKIVATNNDWYDHALDANIQITLDPEPEVQHVP
jgi:hypothetical protein